MSASFCWIARARRSARRTSGAPCVGDRDVERRLGDADAPARRSRCARCRACRARCRSPRRARRAARRASRRSSRSAVEEECRPIFSSSRAIAMPGAPRRTRYARVPVVGVAGEDDERVRVRAVRDPLLGAGDAVRRRPRVRIAPASEPAPGSVSANAASSWPCGERRHEPLDLLGRAVGDDRQRARARVHRDGHADARRRRARSPRSRARRRGSPRPRRRAPRARTRPSARARRAGWRPRAGTVARGPSRPRAARRSRRRTGARGRGSRAARR